MSIETLHQTCRFPDAPPNVPPSDHGWVGPEHGELLTPFLDPKLSLVLEVGSWLVKSTPFIAEHAPNAKVIAIDTWKGSKEHFQNSEWIKMLPTLYETFLKNCWAYHDRILPIRALSWDGLAIASRHDIQPDLIYLDGSHEYEDVKKDLEAILALFPKADLAGDDFMWSRAERALLETMQPRGIPILRKGNVWWKNVPRVTPFVGAQPGF